MKWAFLCYIMIVPMLASAQSTNDRSYDPTTWAAVGRINILGGGFCTGTLISERHVLTAGHCVFDASGRPFNVDLFEFRAGWLDGRAQAYRGVQSVVIHPRYQFQALDGLDRVSSDIAILELAVPIDNDRVHPLAVAPMPPIGSDVAVVSYAHDRADRPQLQKFCQLLGDQTDALVLDCDVDFGSSGAPVFRFDGGVPQIVSVISAKAQMGGMPVALGVKAKPKLADFPSIAMSDNVNLRSE